MITAGDITEIIQDYFDLSIEKRTQYHPYILKRWIGTAWAKVLYNICFAGIKHNDFSQLDPFIKSFKKVEIFCDEDRNEYYSDLPVSVVLLPDNRGIYRISPMKNQNEQIIMVENGMQDIYNESEFALINKTPLAYVEMNRVYYIKMIKELAEYGVLMKLIPTFSDYDDDDVINLPGGKDNDILSLVIQELEGKPIPDSKSNNEEQPNIISKK